ncbi:MAG: hypothetical protein KAQ63_03710 [Candidatus Moranbacteria bacterium]|nr:hypothetical protein [Candidatus Moranbacteria bacterium]
MKTILVDAWNVLFLEDGIFEEMHELLEKYPNRKIVLTNANEEEQKKFGIDKSPYEFFTLSHKPDKIDPVFYEKMLDNFNFKKEDVIYFENDKGFAESARLVGIKTYHYNKDEKNLSKLKEFLDLNL